MNERQEERFDVGSVFPDKGDPRRPPEWFGRGLLYTAIAVFAAVFVWNTWGKIDSIILYVVISMFIALAVEPVVRWLVSHGWKRGVASGVTLVSLLVIICGLLTLFGNMFVQQLVGMVKSLPGLYNQIVDVIESQTNWKVPSMEDLGMEVFKSLQTSTVTNFANQALTTTFSLLNVLLGIMTVALVTYYISAAFPAMRRSLCQWIAPKSQERFLVVWTVVQDQISNFLYSRIILAAISSVCMSIFMMTLNIPYWLPLSIFCGLVSQFIPTVGTYIGGALPVVSAWGTNGIKYALFVLIYIVVYQQIENLILSPAISQRTMDLNPAIAFLAVLALGSVFGALGAFLALPLTASFQTVFKAYTKRYELIDSPLLSDPKPVKKSKMVEGVEAFNTHVVKPVADHMPRAAQGSTARVRVHSSAVSGELEYVHNRLAGYSTSAELDDSQTVAIPKKSVRPDSSKPDLNPSDESYDNTDGTVDGHDDRRADHDDRADRADHTESVRPDADDTATGRSAREEWR
ncbi:AI-2E family transporter [Bifidobacterium callimiconis]|uniref:AI-2E family transporter n=1 Tax=Bifidobacterium callimiconis TaxID=2306973 RepID=A0A430F860_9BIFI|nr:AI-2E family transporter [Bifidobacterium callimiconis]MBT1177370.1 AI-2E family transporter [Bifidobacterium callimiconis]RSX48981.1 AI-2E family transporter [Bifidobacterium callimiconis]